MTWVSLIKSEMEDAYRATDGLMDLVDEDKLDWKPERGENWMSTSELLRHLTNACGWCSEQFVNDSWATAMSGEGEAAPTTVASVAEAKDLLAADKAKALGLVDQVGEEELGSRMVSAPWDPTPRPLGQHLLGMASHLQSHKAQLFYYLKLQGKPVNTFTMYGIPQPPSS